jgi:cyanate permease
MSANQLAIVAAPPIFGLLYDLTGSYRAPFLVTAASLALLGLQIWRRGPRRRETAIGAG